MITQWERWARLEWVRKMRLFDDAASRHDAAKALPDAETMGLVLP